MPSSSSCHAFFKPRPQMTTCPVCFAKVPLKEINQHLDQPGGCIEGVEEKGERSKEFRADQGEEDIDLTEEKELEMDKMDSNAASKEVQSNAEKDPCTRDKDGSKVDVEDDPFSDSDTEFENLDVDSIASSSSQPKIEFASPSKPVSFSSSSQPLPSSSGLGSPVQFASQSTTPTKRFRASRQLSNRPNMFGGKDEINSQGPVLFSTPSPRRRKFSPLPLRSPVKSPSSRKTLFGSPGDKRPSPMSKGSPGRHVPFTQSKKKDPSHVPYYVVNFEHILRCVMDFTDDGELFDDQEKGFVQAVRALGADAKKVYVRLFQRKHSWLNLNQINYEEVEEKEKALEELIRSGLAEDGSELNDLSVLLNLISAPNVRLIAKEMNIQAKGTQKSDFVEALVKHSKKKSVFFNATKENPIEAKLRKRSHSLLGPCYRLSAVPRKVFLRALSLFSLTNWWDERENERGQPQQLTTLLLVNQGKMTFPSFEINRKAKIFVDRAQLLRFEDACGVEAKMSEVFEAKEFERGVEVYREAKEFFQEVLKDEEYTKHVKSLKRFLRKFTTGSVLAYVLTKSVEVFERLKDHQTAVDILLLLLSQDLYLPDYHGHWYERLVLDLDQHLKRPLESIEAVRRGLDDGEVREARKLALCQRVTKICGMKKNKDIKEKVKEFEERKDWYRLEETPEVTIQGRLMPKDNRPGAKTVFVFDDGIDNILCSVEEYVREFYKAKGLTEGLHGEGAVVNTICALLFWDVLYELSPPDVYRSPNQAVPLDYDTDDFYLSRQSEIDDRLDAIEASSDAEMEECVKAYWTRHHGVVSCVNWEIFKGPDHMMGLIKCFDRRQLRGICERLIKNHRYTRSGFPDLTVWNPSTKEVHIIEVKGPNDRLSNKQVLWIDYLNKLGVKAYCCYVEAIGAKRLSKSPATKKNSPKKRKGEADSGGSRKRGKKSEGADNSSRSGNAASSSIGDSKPSGEGSLSGSGTTQPAKGCVRTSKSSESTSRRSGSRRKNTVKSYKVESGDSSDDFM